MPAVDIVQHSLVLPLFGVDKLSLAGGTLGTIELIQKLLLHLPPTINGFWLQGSTLIKSYTL